MKQHNETTATTHEWTIRIECHATNPPTPIGFGVVNRDGKLVAHLTKNTVLEAVAIFVKLEGVKHDHFTNDTRADPAPSVAPR